MNRIRGAWLPLGLVAIAVLALGTLGLARPAGAAVNSLSIVPATQTVPPETTGITVSLEADATAPGIGAYDIDVRFNNTLLRATACTSNAVGVCNTVANAEVNFSGKSAGGLTGSPVELGTITFQTGATSGFSAIEVFVNRLTDPDEADITFPPPNLGEVVISPPNDDDADGVTNAAEDACAGPGAKDLFVVRPERIDDGFAGVDDDADLLVDEALPVGALNFDCDGDGFIGSAEVTITTSDQDACGANGWPAELAGSDNTLNISDLSSFLFPLRDLNGNTIPGEAGPPPGGDNDGHGVFNFFGHTVPDASIIREERWNLQPDGAISIGDVNALNPAVNTTTSRPPMFGSQAAFFTDVGNGIGGCPSSP